MFFDTISHVRVCIIQNFYIRIRTNLHTICRQKNCQKKGFPLELRYAGMCTFSTKRFETRAIQFETQACTILFLYQYHQDNHLRIKTYTNPFPCHSQPLRKYTNKKMVILHVYLLIGAKKTPVLQNGYTNASF